MRWNLKPADVKLQADLSQSLGLSSATVSTLINRGIRTLADADRFFSSSFEMLHDPALLPDMERGLTRITSALTNNERIAICGDYDVDGVSASALLILFFRQLGVNVLCRIPHRINDGYGLNTKMIDQLKSDGASLIITVDNGTSNAKEIDYALNLGIDVVVTDHHEVGNRDVDPRHIIINPKRRDSRFPFPDIAGVGVAFHLLMGLRRHLRNMNYFTGKLADKEPSLRNMLDLVALGTIGDVVPLLDANRLLVKHGMVEIVRTSSPGIRELKRVAGLDDPAKCDIDAISVAFRLSPRINAAGRMSDPAVALRLLITDDDKEATALADQLHSLNTQRQSIEAKILEEAVAAVDSDEGHLSKSSITLSSDTWHPGVIGIVASRLAERYRRPAVLLTRAGDEYRGSLRSVGNYNIIEALQATSSHLLRYGGHHAAAGVSVSPGSINSFFSAFDEYVAKTFRDEDRDETLTLDAEMIAADLTEDFLGELDRLKPYGEGNEEPVFCLKGAQILDKRIVGNNHLKFKVSHNKRTLHAIGFGLGRYLLLESPSFDIAFTPQINEWEGRRSIQLKVIDIKPSC